MKRQAIVIVGLSCQTEYLLLDEAFDGLDPAMRMIVKNMLIVEVVQQEVMYVKVCSAVVVEMVLFQPMKDQQIVLFVNLLNKTFSFIWHKVYPQQNVLFGIRQNSRITTQITQDK